MHHLCNTDVVFRTQYLNIVNLYIYFYDILAGLLYY